MNRKILSLILAIILCLSVFVSCTGNKPKDDTTDTGTADTTSSDTSDDPSSYDSEEAKMVDEYVDDLATQYNFDGEKFVYIDGQGPLYDEEEETGDVEDDALYYRLRDIEEKFGVDFRNDRIQVVADTATGTDKADAIIREVMAGGDAYDIMWGSQGNSVKDVIVANCVYDASSLPQIDFSREWWASGIQDNFAIGDTVYILTGPIIKDFYMDGACMLFNKTVAANFNIDQNSLYDMAREGTWTFDKMTEIASAIPTNNDGNGIYRYLSPSGLGFFYASGMKFISFDDNHDPYVEETLTRELSDLADTISAIMGDKTQAAEYRFYADGASSWSELYGYENGEEMFTDGRALFMCCDTSTASNLREYDVEFGILPMPKYYDTQENYGTFSGEGGVVIIKSISNPDKVGTVIEACAALSIKYLKPALYDKILKGRSVYDVESRDMIDIINKCKVYEMISIFANGDANQMGTVMKLVDESVEYNSSNLASGYRINAKLVNQTIKNIINGIGRK